MFTKKASNFIHPKRLECTSRMWLCFVNHSLQYGYKENIRRSSCISHDVNTDDEQTRPIVCGVVRNRRWGAAVGNSPPFLNESPFRTFRQTFKPGIVVDTFDEMFEMEIRSEKGASCRRLLGGVKLDSKDNGNVTG